MLAVAFVAIALAGCDGSAAGSCATAQDIARKVTALTDDLSKAEGAGKIDRMKAGEIAAAIVAAGAQSKAGRDYRAYCDALDEVRKDSGL
jgi:hypothetical protein